MSKPPKLQPDKYTIVQPIPKSTPIVIMFKNGLLSVIVTFSNSVKYMTRVYTTAPIIDGIVSFKPRQIIPIVTKTMFPISKTYDVFIPNKWSKIIPTPLKPPGTILLGTQKILNVSEMSKHPSIKSIAFIIIFFFIFPISIYPFLLNYNILFYIFL